MDFKVIISNSGDEKLYKTLSKEVERRLPNADVEWRRSYGRSSKNVVLQANFLKLESVELKKSIGSAANLASRPMLHLYWTACADNDQYKSKVKTSINQWIKQLKENDIADWLIVYVVNQDTTKANKSKLQLPRSSVFDKIKSDFSQKKQEKCVQLWEPEKETLFTKSGESWQILLSSLRNLLLESFGRHLDTFEDQIRVLREKYADPDWPFLDYFLVHEELALIYQSVTLKEDALVQYDEVDALLSQFIINSNGKNLPKWLDELRTSPNCWDGVSLSLPNADQTKLLIKSKKASLLELRNYLFAKQIKLLIKLKRKWEIPSRLLDFLLATAQEFKLLEISISDGKIALWMILTCMQLFQHLESFESNDLSYHATKTQLHDLMRNKCYYLGSITGFYHNREQTDQEKDLVNELLKGIGVDDNINENTSTSAVREIINAFSSAINYQKFYLDLSINCMELFYKIKRQHFGLVVGIDIAKFYLEHGNYLEAEPLLEKAWTVYKKQKWQILYTDVLIPLANCQFKHSLFDRYQSSVTLLACAYCLPADVRKNYSLEVIKLSQNKQLDLPVIEFEPILHLSNVKIHLIKNKGHVGDTVKISLSVNNKLTETLHCETAIIRLKHFQLTDPGSFEDGTDNRSLFNPKDYGMNVSITSNDATATPKDESSIKENLTPANILKRLKSHRRTWSRNKNILENSKQNESSESLPTTPNKEPIHKSYSAEDILKSKPPKAVKRNLFSPDLESESSLSNGNVTPHLEMSRSQSMLETNHIKNITLDDKLLEPIATSSVSENTGDQLSMVAVESSTAPSTVNDTAFETENKTSEPPSTLFEVCEPFSLQSGLNYLEFTKEVTLEGRYTIQNIQMEAGQFKFESVLTLPKNLQSFFVVADPPKIAWTSSYMSDYLLSGSKQRLHVTLLNGPGVIKDGSLLRIHSQSGLQFFNLEESSIEIFPLERGGHPREAAISISITNENEAMLKLPECNPYERVNVYFDVLSPINKHQESALQHEIRFMNYWLKDLVETTLQLECIFYSPFNIEKHTYTRGEWCFVHVTVYATNPVPLLLTSAQIVDGKKDNLTDFELMSHPGEVCLFGNENYHFVWRALLKNMPDFCQNCMFKLNFQSKSSDEGHHGLLEENIQITFCQKKYSLKISFEEDLIIKQQQVNVKVTVRRHIDVSSIDYRLFLIVDPSEINWTLAADKTSTTFQEIKFSNDAEVTVAFNLFSGNSGKVPMPLFQLGKLTSNVNDENVEDKLMLFDKYDVDNLSLGKSLNIGELVSDV